MKRMKKLVCLALSLLMLAGCSKGANGGTSSSGSGSGGGQAADSYPEKPVEVVVCFSAGGETDTLARLVFQYAEKYFGQNLLWSTSQALPVRSDGPSWPNLSQMATKLA